MWKCSTPFGIGDRNRLRRLAQRNMRLKRCSTPFGIGDRNRVAAAGVTRRLKRCSTPFGIGDRNSGPSSRVFWISAVLNAFRHRRSEQLCCHSSVWRENRCSTPFGIGDRNSADFSQLDPAFMEVLNAFRHRRSEQFHLPSADI